MNAMPTVPELLAELERVRQNEARYRLLLEHSGEVGWIADCASGRLTYLSPAAGRLFGHDLDSAQPLAQALLRDLPARLARYPAGDASRRSVLRESELPHRGGNRIDPHQRRGRHAVHAAWRGARYQRASRTCRTA